ncbi:MAG: prenyltransferase/squalene oxidase repeat-containing protein [Planctomycetota bacterium]
MKPGLEYLVSLQKDDGSIYQTGLANYVTSAAIMALTEAKDENYKKAIEAARDFLIVLQADEGEGYSLEEDAFFGGMGYGGDERPDLSNTQMSVEALRTAGLDVEHDAFKKAVQFLQKCQNLTEVNPTRIWISPTRQVVAGNDGGGIYQPGDSKADLDEIEKGVYVARSYGSMTYALIKSYLLAGLDPKDQRVQAAVRWIKSHYSLDENPGFKPENDPDASQQGLYYYYLTMARALQALGVEEIESPDGAIHPWRQELRETLLSLQREDGSWLNHRSPRWFEGNPVLATAYALLVLDICQEK